MKVIGINPTLQVHDLKRASEFYVSLGFILDWIWPEENPTHGSVSSGNFSFMFAKVDESTEPEKGDLYFKVEEVEKLYSEIKSKNIKVSELSKTDYGMLDFSLTDPFGHHIVFGQPSGEWEEK
jgi:uncharacterized glyoxalase superfamily protein PhnB